MITKNGNVVHLTEEQDNLIQWRHDLQNVPVGVNVYFKSFCGNTVCWAEIQKKEQANDKP